MNQSLILGPFALPVSLLVLMASVWAGWTAGSRVARSRTLQVETQLGVILIAGLVAARLAFVAEYLPMYAAAPLSALDLRDGGWNPVAGLAAAAVAAGLLALRRRPLAVPLALAYGTCASVWMAASLALSSLEDPGQRLPVAALRDIHGQPVALEQFKGQPVVLNLWASWCPPCVREMPVLQQAQKDHPDVHFVFANQGEQAGVVRSFLARRGMVLQNVLLDPHRELGAGSGYRALPTTLFFDREGRLAGTRSGELSRASLAQKLEAAARR